jgi:adenosylmethionine-8-amino-7-oxononanoate aminotransferase
MKQSELLQVVGGQGARLRLADGRELIDGISSWWCNAHGHCNPRLVKALTDQAATLDHVLFAGCTHEPAVTLAEEVLKVLPGAPVRVFYSDNGSTAVEVAIKLALQFHANQGDSRRKKIVALHDAYHGDTFGAMAAGARSIFSAPFDELLFSVDRLSVRGDEHDLERCRALAASNEVAAFIFEPRVQGAGGMVMYEAAVLDRYIEIFRKADVLCIADEVMTGFGRTGALFASSELQYPPDMICISKALTGGMLPLAITAVSQDVFDGFISADHSRTFFHGHTYTANPMACAVAIESLRISTSDECAHARAHIEARHRECSEVLSRETRVKDARVAGTILALTLSSDDGQRGYRASLGVNVRSFFAQRGVLLRPLGDVLYFMPPYCITDDELTQVYRALQEYVKGAS